MSKGLSPLLAATSVLAFTYSSMSEPLPAKASRDPAAVARLIDQEIQKKLDAGKVKASPLADDAEFLRRVYLDLTGRIPTAEKAAAFLDSKNPDKRRLLIDELLTSPNYGQYFGTLWRDLIVKGDDNNDAMATEGFRLWLADRFNKNPGWDVTVRAMLTAEGRTLEKPEGTFFLANRNMSAVSPSKVVASATKLFMGNQLQCAECHNHPFTKSWKREDFWSLAAFFSRTRNFGKAQNGRPVDQAITESPTPLTGAGTTKRGVGPDQPDGMIKIPLASDPEKTVKTVKPKYFLGQELDLADKKQYRPYFATWLTAADNPYFARAAVNRWWAHFFARGIINPVDEASDDNLPSHPELLDLLSKEFADSGFDLKHLTRCICNSQAYQRTSRPLPENKEDKTLFSHMTVKVMNADMLYDSLVQAMGVTELGAAKSKKAGKRRGGSSRPLKGDAGRKQFTGFFDTLKEADPDVTETGHGIPQFLRLMNSPEFCGTIPVVERLVKSGKTKEQTIEAMYLTALARRPSAAELQRFIAFLASGKDPNQDYHGIYWILLNSAEFVCNR